jgi:predicted transcriptional regulator
MNTEVESAASSADRSRAVEIAHIAAGVLTALVTSSRIGNADDAVSAYEKIYDTVSAKIAGTTTTAAAATKPVPAVNPKKSIHDDFLICLEDGKKFKSLKRHLMTHYGLSPDAYREKWGLASDYPMVAPNYAAARSDLAKKMGLGKKR